MSQSVAFASGIPSNIYGFYPYTGNSTDLFHTQFYQFPEQFRSWAAGFHSRLNKTPTLPLRPVIPSNACTPRITAAAGTELAGAYSSGTVKFLPW